jgi:hypothetical protein
VNEGAASLGICGLVGIEHKGDYWVMRIERNAGMTGMRTEWG